MENSVFKALADPTRRQILKLLKGGDKNAGELLKNFNMTGASLNHHLNLLKNADLVTVEKKGQFMIYSLNTTVFQEILEWIFEIKGEEHET
ncbi:MAG: autorepressor SdpR family transcription factor [Spirochaetia bacterium]|nr:autorepressor SdpR family transcription factor [Spirochaetia bacterium]